MTTAEAFHRAAVAMRELIAAWERAQARIEEERWSTHFANPANHNTGMERES